MKLVEQPGVIKTYSLPFSWSWECIYCNNKNPGDCQICLSCKAPLWEEEVIIEST